LVRRFTSWAATGKAASAQAEIATKIVFLDMEVPPFGFGRPRSRSLLVCNKVAPGTMRWIKAACGLAVGAPLGLADAMVDLLIAAALASSACAAAQDLTADQPACQPQPESWRTLATEDDRRRLREWRRAWQEALEDAGAANAADIAAEGPLLEADSALRDPMPPPGDYDCRTLKIGTPSDSDLTYVAYPAFRCRISVEGRRISFSKLTGSQRPIGRLFADNERRLIFLGTMQLGDERRAFRYGTDRERDLAGILERVGDRRWRLVFPYPHFESLLDVIELTP
jgi:hypothetical protein